MTAVFFNGDFYCLVTQSIGMIAYAEQLVAPQFLPPTVDDTTLGQKLRFCLDKSRQVDIAEFQRILSSGNLTQPDEDRVKVTMQLYGYKTKRTMYKNMNYCSVNMKDGQIEIQPMHHKSLDSYTATKSGPELLCVAADVSDSELGIALKEAFKRCTSAL